MIISSIKSNFIAGYKNSNKFFKVIIKVTFTKEEENVYKLFTLFNITINFSET